MELKKVDVPGSCRVLNCNAALVAIADGKTFFSKRSREIPLCEQHLFIAQEMAETLGNELKWQEAVPETIQNTDLTPKAEAKLRKELGDEATEAEKFWSETEGFEIRSKEDLEFAAEVLNDIKGKLQTLEAKRKEITTPLNKAIKAVNDLFRPATEYYEKCQRFLKQRVTDAHRKAEEQAALALQEAAAAAATQDQEALDTALAVHDAAIEFPTTQGLQYRSTWKFEIVDESQIPREYLTPNVRLIQGVVTHEKGNTNIPGIRVYEDKTVASVG